MRFWAPIFCDKGHQANLWRMARSCRHHDGTACCVVAFATCREMATQSQPLGSRAFSGLDKESRNGRLVMRASVALLERGSISRFGSHARTPLEDLRCGDAPHSRRGGAPPGAR